MHELSTAACINAPADIVYELIADITRMGEWSPENKGGEWLNGAEAAAAGARFRGRNRRRVSWSTTAVVTDAERGRTFAFAVGRGAPADPDTTWSYTFKPATDGGCIVTETCTLMKAPGRLGRILTRFATGVSWEERAADLVTGMEETLRRLALVAEAQDLSHRRP
ncbi:MAG: SRPBCC family protein [Candidatus Dormibacteria bacterium]